LGTASAAAFAAMSAPALAQSAADAGGADEIIVTGEKTPRSLEDTQASVGVVTAQDIVRKDLQSFRDAFRLIGNVLDADFLDAGFIIRGVNSEGLTPGGAPLATVYIDGAAQTVQGTRRGTRGLWDVGQVEVYRGPQSTLSGRASLAGAIYISTRDPQYDWDLRARATIAELETWEGAVAFGGPIVEDKIAFRVAGEYQRRASEIAYPTFRDFNLFDDLVEDEYWQARGKLLFTPAENLRAVASVSYAEDSPAYDDVAGPGFGFEFSGRRGDFNSPFFQEVRSADNLTSSFRVEYGASEAIALTSLTTFADTELRRPSVNAGTPGEIFVNEGVENETFFTQELRANYDRGAVQAVLGLYFANDGSDTVNARTVPFGGGRTDRSTSDRSADNYAIFGEATWRFAPRFRLVAGGRLDHLDQDTATTFARDNFNPATPDIASADRTSNSETVFLPKAGVVIDLAERQTLGFTAQRGFRSGGAAINFNGVPYEFNPEFTWTYEASYRGGFGPLLLSVNGFYTDWKDQQVELQLVPGDFTTQVITNAGASRVFGAEAEARASLSNELDAFASFGWVDTKFTDFNTDNFGDFTGLEFPEAPSINAAFGADWEDASGLFAGFDAKYIGEFLARDLQNAPLDTVGDFWTVNLRAGFQAKGWRVMFFADNLFNEQYLTYRDRIDFGDPSGPFDCCATLGRSRVAGVTLQLEL
jgi:outer membrane receptor protein involved in Fe transport